jgi:PAS domain S-box-containing protein
MAEKNYSKLNLTLIHNLNRKIEELKKSKENYKGLFDNAVDAMFVANPVTRQVVNCNKSAEKLMGYSRDKILSMKADDLHSKELRKKTMEGFKKQAEGKIKSIFSDVLTKDNKRIPVEISASGINIGNERYIQAIFRDISERKKAEKELKESETKFKTIFENANDGILVADAKTKKFIFANPKICELTGYSLKELLNLSVGEIHLKKDLPYVIEQFTKQLQRKIEIAKDIPILKKDKSVVCCDINSALANIDGKDVIIGFFRDVTERKKAEEALKQSTEEWQKTFDLISDMVFIQDKDFRIIHANKALARFLKVKPEKLIGRKCYEILHKLKKPWPTCPTAKALKSKKPQTQIVDDPNIGTPLLVSSCPIVDKEGDVSKIVHIARSISGINKAGQELIKQRKR